MPARNDKQIHHEDTKTQKSGKLLSV